MQKGITMDHMIKVVDEYTGVVVACLDPNGIDPVYLGMILDVLSRAYAGAPLSTYYPGE